MMMQRIRTYVHNATRSRRHALCGMPSPRRPEQRSGGPLKARLRREGPRCLRARMRWPALGRRTTAALGAARAHGRFQVPVLLSHSHLGGQRREHNHKSTTKNMYVRAYVQTNKHRRPRGPRGPRREGPKWMGLMPSWKVHQRPCSRRCCAKEPYSRTPRSRKYSAARCWLTCSARSSAVRRTPLLSTSTEASGRIRAVRAYVRLYGRVHTMTYAAPTYLVQRLRTYVRTYALGR